MDINLKNAAPRLFPDSRFEMVYFEAVSNALDAHATKIDIEIEYSNSEFKKFIITDNGIGFNDENYNRFSNLMETKDNSHKGQGRVVYLIYFENIEVISRFSIKKKHKKRVFNFNYDFEKANNIIEDCETSQTTGTRLSFSGKATRKISKLDVLRSEYIREQIFSEFLPSLFKMKQDEQDFEITITSKVNNEDESISKIKIQDIPDFQSILLNTNELTRLYQSSDIFKKSESYLYYFLKKYDEEHGVSSIITSFAIDSRAIKIDIIDKPNYLPNVEAIFFLTSTHFEGCVDPTRQELTLKPEELKWVKRIFRNYVKDILKENFPEYQEIINSRKNFLENRFPHLMDYIDSNEIGFKSNREVIKDAQDEFFKQQREILEKDEDKFNDEDYLKALDLSSKNLAEYILFRQIQIKRLKTVKTKDREKIIHNIISPMKQTYSSGHNHDLFKNNAWILDDRFMTYIQAASDVSLQEITSQFNQIFQQKTTSKNRPDYLMFFSNTLKNESDKVDLVCFEFKRLGVSLEEKTKAVTELTKYIKQLKAICPNIQRVWLYALVDFDDELEESLESQDFKMKFSTQGKIWYRYYENIESELAFLDFNAVVSDADSRNKTFMEILKKGFSYNEDE